MIFDFIIVQLYVLFCCFEGITDAYYFYIKIEKANYERDLNEHKIFFEKRLIVGSIVSLVLAKTYWQIIAWLIVCDSMFPFFHEGFYYTWRNILNIKVYPRTFRDSTTTSVSKMNFNFKQRLILFIFAVIVFFLIEYYNYKYEIKTYIFNQ